MGKVFWGNIFYINSILHIKFYKLYSSDSFFWRGFQGYPGNDCCFIYFPPTIIFCYTLPLHPSRPPFFSLSVVLAEGGLWGNNWTLFLIRCIKFCAVTSPSYFNVAWWDIDQTHSSSSAHNSFFICAQYVYSDFKQLKDSSPNTSCRTTLRLHLSSPSVRLGHLPALGQIYILDFKHQFGPRPILPDLALLLSFWTTSKKCTPSL